MNVIVAAAADLSPGLRRAVTRLVIDTWTRRAARGARLADQGPSLVDSASLTVVLYAGASAFGHAQLLPTASGSWELRNFGISACEQLQRSAYGLRVPCRSSPAAITLLSACMLAAAQRGARGVHAWASPAVARLLRRAGFAAHHAGTPDTPLSLDLSHVFWASASSASASSVGPLPS